MTAYWVCEYFNCYSTWVICRGCYKDAFEAGYEALFAENNRHALNEDMVGAKVRKALEAANYWELSKGGDSLRLRPASQEEFDRFNDKGY